MNKLSETEKAYIAGLLDGEGCLTVGRLKPHNGKREHRFICRILVVNTDLTMMLWLQKTVGDGGIYEYKKAGGENWKPCHRWYLNGQKSIELIRQVYPYLQIKRRQAELLLNFPANYKNFKGLSDEQYFVQEKTFERMKNLNRRGLVSAN